MPSGVPADAEEIVGMAWDSLPAAHRRLLETLGASRWRVVSEPLGVAVDGFRRSAGLPGLTHSAKKRLAEAFGVWIQELRVVLINAAHPDLAGLSAAAAEGFLARVAWHEWGHALSITRCSREDVFNGRKLLELCPPGVREGIRVAGYRPQSYTHELVAEIYALLMERRLRGASGQPSWLDDEIYSLLGRTAGWEG
jgi:hypothetical protein